MCFEILANGESKPRLKNLNPKPRGSRVPGCPMPILRPWGYHRFPLLMNTCSKRIDLRHCSAANINAMHRLVIVPFDIPASSLAACPHHPAASIQFLCTSNVRSGTGVQRRRDSTIANASARAPNPFLSVVFPTALTLMLCNMDRICMAVAVIPMAKEFGWPLGLQGVIQGAFLWGYAATQLMGGMLAGRHGGKIVMAFGVAWFSIASVLLPLSLSPPIIAAGLSIPAILAARCMVGLGEGVAMPAMSNLIATFIPKEAKARALGLSYSGFHGGNLLGLFLSPLLLLSFGWRSLFYIYGN